MNQLRDSKSYSFSRLFAGVLVIAVGLIFLLENLQLLEAAKALRFWPVALIVIGTAKIFDARGSRGFGVVLAAVGTWLLLENFGLVTLSFAQLWPVVLIAVGGLLIRRAFLAPLGRAGWAEQSTFTRAAGFLSGNRVTNSSPEFRGGEATAILGGCELDLRGASTGGAPAVLDVFAFWGGMSIYVPKDWTVTSRVTPLLGGYVDKTEPSAVATGQNLTVRGVVIMGGIEVSNGPTVEHEDD
ncbi:MAG TPA: DUF5668 domain-containing protein [Thermoanaerobaculia bacterium]|nr:DUF5668 domain-containing protein [Thermoanaerobaculia bacterium]